MRDEPNRKNLHKCILTAEEILWSIKDLDRNVFDERENEDIQKAEELCRSVRDMVASTLRSYQRRVKNK